MSAGEYPADDSVGMLLTVRDRVQAGNMTMIMRGPQRHSPECATSSRTIAVQSWSADGDLSRGTIRGLLSQVSL